jgi:predicted Zn-dependent protease
MKPEPRQEGLEYPEVDNIKPKNPDEIPSGNLLLASNTKMKKSGSKLPENIYIRYTAYSPNYFRIDRSDNSLWDGKHWHQSDYPLNVFIRKSNSRHFKSKYLEYVDYALEVWQETDSRIIFQYTNSVSEADIVISFERSLLDKYNENYLGLTNYEVNEFNIIIKSNVEISLLKFNNKKISDGEIKSTIIHEVGHALGLGHSDNKLDLMFPYINPGSSDEMTFIELSKGDIKAIQSLISLGFSYQYSNN